MKKTIGVSTEKRMMILYGVLFISFAALVYLVPYSHDDWAWGCEVGIQRFESNFEAYNGRYLGNYFVLAMTRSKLLQVVIIAASTLALCILPGMYFGKNTLLLTIFSALLVVMMPKDIFTQTVVWTSGYSNYMPPILTTVIYFVLIKNIFWKREPRYSKFLPFITAALGFAGSLFMEHVTLYNLAVSILILLFVFIKYKKVFLSHIAFAVGCLVGTVVMFTNSAYGLIAGANDAQGGYRSTALSSGLIQMLKENIATIGEELFIKNIFILFVMSVLLVFLAFSFIKKSDKEKMNKVALVTVSTNIICLFIIYAKSKYEYWFLALSNSHSEIITLLVLTFVMILYCVSLLVLVLICVRDRNMMCRMLLILVSIPVVTVPLAIVSPISARCFLPQYFLMVIFSVMLLGYVQKELSLSKTTYKITITALSATLTAAFIFLFSVYSTIYSYAEKRDEYVQKQINNGETVVKLCELPNSSYIYIGTPYEKMWADRFKMFYGIDKELELEILSYDEFDAWTKEYDEKEVN